MKEIYEKISIDISILKAEDAIASSSNFDDDFDDDFNDDEHDNGYFDWDSFE